MRPSVRSLHWWPINRLVCDVLRVFIYIALICRVLILSNIFHTVPEAVRGLLQMAIKTELGVSYFNDTLPGHLLFEEQGKLDGPTFVASWKAMADDMEQQLPVQAYFTQALDDIIKRYVCIHDRRNGLSSNCIHHVRVITHCQSVVLSQFGATEHIFYRQASG